MRRIKVPAKIKIGGYNYTIRQNRRVNRELDSAGMWGRHSATLREIQVATDGNMSDQQYSQTFLHELTHAISNVYCEGREVAESEVAAISNGFFQVLEEMGVRFIR
jgi:hypothetical protein